MIVVSGVLVAVALVLLVIGLQVSLAFIYASIGVSVLAFLVLGVAARQRRRAPVPTAEPAARTPAPVQPADLTDEPADRPRPVHPVAPPLPWPDEPALPDWRSGPEPEPPVEDDDDLLEDEDLLGGERYGGTVLVVPGRPRYHVAGCRYLLDKESAELDVVDAREEGFQPCGICRPDVVLAAELADADLAAELRGQRDDVVRLDGAADGAEPDEDDLALLEPDEPDVRRSASGGSLPVATRPRPVAARADPAPAQGAPTRARAAPADPGVHAAPAAPAAPVAPPEPDVLLIRDRGRYHRPGCRYAGGATAEPVGPDAARATGALPCGICRP